MLPGCAQLLWSQLHRCCFKPALLERGQVVTQLGHERGKAAIRTRNSREGISKDTGQVHRLQSVGWQVQTQQGWHGLPKPPMAGYEKQNELSQGLLETLSGICLHSGKIPPPSSNKGKPLAEAKPALQEL